MTSIELLDNVLELLAEGGDDSGWFSPTASNYAKLMETQWHSKVDFKTVLRALEKLESDGFASSVGKVHHASTVFESRESSFYITLDGHLFYQQGGYKAHLDRQNAERYRMENMEREQRINARRTTVLTAILAFFSAVAGIYYIVEMAQPDMLICSISFLTVCFAFIAGAVAALLAVLLWKEIHKT